MGHQWDPRGSRGASRIIQHKYKNLVLGWRPKKAFAIREVFKLDQGALGMSDPCGTLQLALKPNSVPRNNCLLTNFYFCAN